MDIDMSLKLTTLNFSIIVFVKKANVNEAANQKKSGKAFTLPEN
jgi:hypothetical protein